ncbi:unnamed protein product [Prunus brigantina]
MASLRSTTRLVKRSATNPSSGTRPWPSMPKNMPIKELVIAPWSTQGDVGVRTWPPATACMSAAATKYWVTEKELYDEKSNKCLKSKDECGHYLAVVWGKTTEVGCGISKCKDGKNYVVCSYDPMYQPEDERPY